MLIVRKLLYQELEKFSGSREITFLLESGEQHYT